MKSILRLSLLVAFVCFFSSCRKHVDTGYAQLTGKWFLSNASQGDGYRWNTFYTGFEPGVFNFYSDGTATYSDAQSFLEGYWTVTTVTSGYYDQFGHYINDVHQEMQLNIQDYYTGEQLNLYFNQVDYQGSIFYGNYYDGNYATRYNFIRY
ncbi:hypothetical protein SAMN05421788_101218 [Filimonas lacunae]|uniref:Lipocalin-like domain-containing protein n=1 Tax=Filimonas lacunae TaxID=477680 RepID=A0A173MM97_9BACT|nr:hypothetical protein [Filimonas lacunae]BAV08762.1 hypothetical protein FLA_4809 [Filimonas lacunae]SIS61306.1 hypothetical protein SAMN05421788_101218 [Filimonas lacunae]